MKRYFVAAFVAVLAMALSAVLLSRRGGSGSQVSSEPPQQAREVPTSSNAADPGAEASLTDNRMAPALAQEPDEETRQAERVRRFNDTRNVPVAFYGLVVDQDSNALQNVKVELEVSEHYVVGSMLVSTGRTTHLQRETGADGRFEVSGLHGDWVTVASLTKDGYEPEVMRRSYGDYGAQSGSFAEPILFRLWSTSLHEQLITGEKSFVIIPDGRHYGIDLVQGTIAAGDQGDLVAWVERPELVRPGQRYSWSCQLAVAAGGLLETQSRTMFMAPEAGYTNVFAHKEEASSHRWGDLTGDKRFYVKLRNGGVYGCITIGLFAYYNAQTPGLIRLSYAVNPSGSRLLR